MRKPRSRSIAAPAPEACPVAESGANGIEHDVSRELEQMRMPLDHLAVKPTLEQMALVTVPPVEPFREDAVQPVHPTRDVGIRRFDEKVIVVRHQAIRIAAPFERGGDLFEQLQESEAVVRVREDFRLAIPASCYVVDRPGGLGARRPAHVPTVAASSPSARAWHKVGAGTARNRRSETCTGARHEPSPLDVS